MHVLVINKLKIIRDVGSPSNQITIQHECPLGNLLFDTAFECVLFEFENGDAMSLVAVDFAAGFREQY